MDEALRIRREEEIPVYEKVGDVRVRAVALRQIADILKAQGELDEALRIYREEGIPVFEKIGDTWELLVARANMAVGLLQRSADGDREQAAELLGLALREAERLRIPEADQIRAVLARHGLPVPEPDEG